MMVQILEFLRHIIESIILQMGYPGIALVMFLETVFPPIPSELVLPFAGSLAAAGRFSLPAVILIATLGALSGAVVFYQLGARVPEARLRGWVRRFGRYALISEQDLDHTLSFFQHRGPLVVFFGRLMSLVRSLISIPAGMFHMPAGKFLLYSVLGTGLWNLVLSLAGYWLAERWAEVLVVVEAWEDTLLILLLITVPLLFFLRRFQRHRRDQRIRAGNLPPATPLPAERLRAFSQVWQPRAQAAAQAQDVPAALVLAVLLDEAQRYDRWDRLQDAAMRLVLGAPRAFQTLLRRVWQILSGKALEDQSFGPSQMTLRVQRELTESQYLPALTEPGWQGLLRRGQDETQAAHLVAARLRQIRDHWQAQGVDLSQQWDVLGTLYSIGLTSERGIHAHPQANHRGQAIAAAAQSSPLAGPLTDGA
ncbi:DedA family protein [Levilinea saccharolytica]|uniref:DedA family protein n=1 Tax=Levilinea saccharolytica TaxID=229921 RepID=UPI000783A3FC|nr:DedA family protein [Levilinea saccharolytica]GAP16462.1 uncharacterized membrane-associated protein [Levilinea saccharolytica]